MWLETLAVTFALPAALGLNNGLGLTPAMGVNTWNSLRCDGITADAMKSYTDKVVALGLDKLGYSYVNIDDCWSGGRDPFTNELYPNPKAFPKGIKDLADYVHSKGLKIGIYGDRGVKTCGGFPGSKNYEEIDAKTYAGWSIDYLKHDSCFATTDHKKAIAEYARMRDALNATGRPILFSLCGWNAWYSPLGNTLGNSWRISSDSDDWPHIYAAVRTNEALADFAGPGGFNDPDMLIGSDQRAAIYLTPTQQRSQFNLWAVMAAPLLIGNNLLFEDLPQHDLDTLRNARVIAVDQDPLGVQGRVVFSNCPKWIAREQNNMQPWFYPIAKARFAIHIASIIAFVLFFLTVGLGIYLKGNVFVPCLSENMPDESPSYYHEIPDTDKSPEFATPAQLHARTSGTCRTKFVRVLARVLFWTFLSGAVLFAGFSMWVAGNLFRVDECQQVWAKTLTEVGQGGVHDVALVLMNWSRKDSVVTCGTDCLASIGFKNGTWLEDLWDSNSNSTTAPWVNQVSALLVGAGGSRMFRLHQNA